MRRLLCTILLVLSTIFTAPVIDAQVKIGLKMGFNIANASIDKNLFSSSNRLGFLIGPMVDIKLPVSGLGIDIAVQYNCKNSELNATDDSGLSSGVPCFHTIEIPLNAKWEIGNSNIISAFAETGPQIAWNIGSQSLKQVFNTNQYTIHGSNFSWNAGFGVTFLKKFRIGYTYNIAIGATADVDFINDMGDVIHGKLKNSTHQIYLTNFF